MLKQRRAAVCAGFVIVTLMIVMAMTRAWGLQVGYYEQQCPHAEKTVKAMMEGLLLSDITAGAALLRLVFHDCQVQVAIIISRT